MAAINPTNPFSKRILKKSITFYKIVEFPIGPIRSSNKIKRNMSIRLIYPNEAYAPKKHIGIPIKNFLITHVKQYYSF